MRNTADIVVIGGGIQGLSCVFHLAAKGIKNVSLVELEFLGSGSSGRSAAMLVHAMWSPQTILLSRLSAQEFFAFKEIVGEEFDYKPIGHMNVATAAAEHALREEIAMQQSMDVPIEILDPASIKRAVPALNVKDLVLGDRKSVV